MGLQIIIKGKTSYGRTRAEQESNLRKDGMFGMTEENYDKLKFVEKKLGVKRGFIRQTDLSKGA
jgi:hypothetical protein